MLLIYEGCKGKKGLLIVCKILSGMMGLYCAATQFSLTEKLKQYREETPRHTGGRRVPEKDRVFCLCAQSRENKKVKKCVKLKYGCCGLIECSKKTSKLLFFFNPFCLPCSAASNLFRIDNKLFYQKNEKNEKMRVI